MDKLTREEYEVQYRYELVHDHKDTRSYLSFEEFVDREYEGYLDMIRGRSEKE